MSEALFQLGQKALIINEKLEVLMVGSASVHDPAILFWDLPGGRVDDYEEDLGLALDRETMEEIQCEIEVHDLLTLSIAKSKHRPQIRVALAIYHCSIKHGDPKPANEVEEIKWVHIDKMVKLQDSRYDKETIDRIKEKLDIN